jgi:hypothetical protein
VAYVGHFLPRLFVAISVDGLWAQSTSSIGTLNAWYVTAFTQGNDLPWNAQTVFGCPCALDACPGVKPYGLTALLRTFLVCHLARWMSICYPVFMDKHKHKPTTVRLEPQDREAIETIKKLYGCPSDVAAIRLALRMVARQEVRPDAPASRTAERGFYPHG